MRREAGREAGRETWKLKELGPPVHVQPSRFPPRFDPPAEALPINRPTTPDHDVAHIFAKEKALRDLRRRLAARAGDARKRSNRPASSGREAPSLRDEPAWSDVGCGIIWIRGEVVPQNQLNIPTAAMSHESESQETGGRTRKGRCFYRGSCVDPQFHVAEEFEWLEQVKSWRRSNDNPAPSRGSAATGNQSRFERCGLKRIAICISHQESKQLKHEMGGSRIKARDGGSHHPSCCRRALHI